MHIDVLGQVDMLHISGLATLTSGTSPSLTITMVGLLDPTGTWWGYATPISAKPLTVGAETLFQGIDADAGSAAKFRYLQLEFQLGGTSARSWLEVWVTGRDYSRRARSLTTATIGGLGAT
jgi:hypothetical protein